MVHDPGVPKYSQAQAILTQTVHAAQRMKHIDELLLWLAETFIRNFDVQVAQFWSSQAKTAESIELRVLVGKDASLPYTSVVNSQIISVAASHLQAQRNLALQLVYRLLPADNARSLSQYQLNYCCGLFMGGDTFLSLSATQPTAQPRPVSMALLLLLFFQIPSPHLPVISYIVERIVPIARNHSLLLVAPQSTSPPVQQQQSVQPQQPIKLSLAELVPRQVEDPTDNPLGNTVSISDKNARRVYEAIDGRRNVSQLCARTHLSEQDVHIALQKLLKQHYIHVYEPGGKCVDIAI